MIYLTNDIYDQAVYFDLRRKEPHRRAGVMEHHFIGLLGNGVNEVAVTVRSGKNGVDMAFGRGELFNFVEESAIRKMLGDAVRDMTLH
jgi:hypothetical protein